MKIIVPQVCTLASTGSNPVFVATAWAQNTNYAKDVVVRREISSVWKDFKCLISHNSGTGTWYSPGATFGGGTYWQELGLAAFTGGYTYTTNVRHSNVDTWTSGAAVTAWNVLYDPQSHRDYRAAVDITTGNNTVRPSAAVVSATEEIAARWVDLGAANAFAPFDEEIQSKLVSYDSSGAVVNPTFTYTATVTQPVDHLFFAGLRNIKTISATVSVASPAFSQTVTKDLTVGNAWGTQMGSAVLPFTSIAAGSIVNVAVTLTNNVAASPSECGMAGMGYAYELGDSLWGVETSLIDFSRVERNEVYGTVKFMKRGNAKTLRATCLIDPAVKGGDVIMLVLRWLSGRAVMMDFNNTGSDYDRLRIFGFFSNVTSLIQAASYESLSMDVEGLVE